MRASFKLFRGGLRTWESLFEEAGEFATEIGPERLISISHSVDNVVVWFWE